MLKKFGLGYFNSREVVILENGKVIAAYSRKELYDNIWKLLKGNYAPAISDEYIKLGEVAVANDKKFIASDGRNSICGNGFEELKNVIDYIMEKNLKECSEELLKYKERNCKNCKHYSNVNNKKVCVAIDDSYTEHYCGYFMPPSDFSCNKFER